MRRRPVRAPFALAAAVALVVSLAACGGTAGAPADPTSGATDVEAPEAEPAAPETSAPETSEPAAPEPAPEDATAVGTGITTGSSEFGTMLFDEAGQAIYIWEVETTSEARCYDDCAVAWPPVLTDGEPVAGGETVASLLGTTVRTDGSTQVTYNGHPLYYYAHEAPGEVRCHDVATHGGLWWVVQPDGNRAP